jgi:hypothetical protein
MGSLQKGIPRLVIRNPEDRSDDARSPGPRIQSEQEAIQSPERRRDRSVRDSRHEKRANDIRVTGGRMQSDDAAERQSDNMSRAVMTTVRDHLRHTVSTIREADPLVI